jgi:Undecaprenyl-phosphate glucose phosphotransferase
MSNIKKPIFDQTALPGRAEASFAQPAFAHANPRKWPLRYHSIGAAAVILDVFTIGVASLISSLVYDFYWQGMHVDLGKPLGLAMLVSVLFCLTLNSQGMYKPLELLGWQRQVRSVVGTWLTIFLLLAGIVFTLKIGASLSRGTNLLFAGLGLTCLAANRVILWQLLKVGLAEKRFSGRKVILITDSEHVDHVLKQTLSAAGFDVTGQFALSHHSVNSTLRRRLAASVIECVRGTDIEGVIVAADPNRWSEIEAVAEELRVLPFPITFMPHGAIADIFRRPSHDIGGTVCVELQRGPLSKLELIIKRAIDLMLAGSVLLLLLPLLALVSIAIKLDSSGPVLFIQQRLGFNGRTFNIRKFRTMTVQENGMFIVQARANDNRVTRVGRWLRRTSVDELPQLLNVLDGSMSLVGPRPHAVAHDNQFDKLVRNYGFRQRVKPGLTGWAQINGYRGPTPTADLIERRVEYDLWYIENWSLKLDLVILLQTPLEILRGNNAY